MCLPMNNKTFATMIDIAIILENNLYKVLGLTEHFEAVVLGEFNNVLDAYGCKVFYGFDGCTYEIAINAFENKVIEFTLD